MQQMGAQRNAVELTGKGIECTLTQCGAVLPNGGQGRCSIAAEGNVIMSHNADVLRHPQSQFAAVEHGAVGQHIMTADNGSTAIL